MTEAPAAPTPTQERSYVLAFAGLATAVALVRLYHCLRIPANTGDDLRHIFYGLLVLKHGLGPAGSPLKELVPGLSNVVFSELPYNYPPVTLGFFTLLAGLWPTVAMVKLALTAIEGVNAWLVGRLSGSRWLGLLYWASPISIWSVSREGQFEPLQAVFMLAAVALLRRRPGLAFALLSLAVQVKLTALLLVPLFVYRIVRDHPTRQWQSLGAFALGFAPTLIAMAWYPVLGSIAKTFGYMHYNPYFWNVTAREMFLWNPGWLIALNALVSYGAIAFLLWRARKSAEPVAYSGAILFLLALKWSALGQFWYVLLFPAFVIPIPERNVRFWLIALTPLLDVYSFAQVVVGPFGFLIGDYWSGISVTTPFGLR